MTDDRVGPPDDGPPEDDGTTNAAVARLQYQWRQFTAVLRDALRQATATLRRPFDERADLRERVAGYREELNAANQQLDAAYGLLANVDLDAQPAAWRAAAETWMDNSLSSTGSAVGYAASRSSYWLLGAQVAGFYHGLHENGVTAGHAAFLASRYVVALFTRMVGESKRGPSTAPTTESTESTESTETPEQVAHV